MQITAVIVDDKPKNCEALEQQLLKWCPSVKILAKAHSAVEGHQAVLETTPDLVFLDVEMPNGSGFDMLKKFETVTFEIVFTTAFTKYAIDAIKCSALDYLLKPIDTEELKSAVKKVRTKKAHVPDLNNMISTLLNNLDAKPAKRKIVIPDMRGLFVTQIRDIVRCEADGNYSQMYLQAGEKYLSSRSLGFYEDLLEESNFFRVHRAHLINMDYVASFSPKNEGTIFLTNGDQIQIANRRKKAFLDRLDRLDRIG